MSVPLNELREKAGQNAHEFDLLVKILKIFERDEYNYELRIKDLSGEMWFIAVPKLRYQRLKEGEVIRIRSIKINTTSKRNIIETKPSTNILRFTAKNAIVQELKKNVESETIADKMMLEDDKEIIMSPVLMTEITQPDAMKLPLYRLDDLFLNYDDIPVEERKRNLFRVRFYALRIDPMDPRECVQALNPDSKETFSCIDLDGATDAKTKEGKMAKFMYRIQLLVKDQASQLNKNFYRVLLYAHEKQYGEDFFPDPVKPCNLYAKENEDVLEALKLQIKNLTRFNVWCDALLERQNNFFVIRDTKVRDLSNSA